VGENNKFQLPLTSLPIKPGAGSFWEELQAVANALKELQGTLAIQESPAVELSRIKQQHEKLHTIKHEIEQMNDEVQLCQRAGQQLVCLCGESDQVEVKKHIVELNLAWEKITTLYVNHEDNLVEVMKKVMEFHETLNVNFSFISLTNSLKGETELSL